MNIAESVKHVYFVNENYRYYVSKPQYVHLLMTVTVNILVNFNKVVNQLMQLCTARTAWSDSDQAVQAVHSCNSW